MANKGFNKLNVPLSLSMDRAVPVDYNSFFKTYADAASAASTAVEAGEDGSKYFIGELITVADVENDVIKYYKITSERTLQEIAAEYSISRGLSSYSDEHGNTVIQLRDDIYNNIDQTYTLTKVSSGNWTTSYNTVNTLSGKWEDISSHVTETSASADSVYTTVEGISSRWNYAYNSINQWMDKWNAVYYTMLTTSAKWHNTYLKTLASSAKWDNSSLLIESTSANNASVYSTVYNTSGEWTDAFTRSNKIYSVIPEETWETNNELADKAYVQGQVRTMSSIFRGSFASWTNVPTTSAGYNSDITGNKSPLNNDYIIVLDDSENTTTALVSSNPVGEIVSKDVMDFYGTTVIVPKNTELSASHISVLKTNNIESVEIYRIGSWRYRYVGTWIEGYQGKNNWISEYRVSNSSFTPDQIAALNSGITRQKSDKIIDNSLDIANISEVSGNWNGGYTAASLISADSIATHVVVSEMSADWNTVVEKIAEDYFKYYTMSAWSILTEDDTNYENVPSGMILIYEDDGSTPTPVPSGSLSIYTKADGYLKFSKYITYDSDFNILYIGGDASFDFDTNTLTIPGSSDVATDSIFNIDTGIFTLSESFTWNEITSSLEMGAGTVYDSSTGSVTIPGKGVNTEEKTTFSVVNVLTHATNSNTATFVNKTDQYIAIISPVDDTYRLTTLSCTMGGIMVEPYGTTSFKIEPPITGDIVITAIAELKSSTTYTITNNLTNAVNSNSATSISYGTSYSAYISPSTGYSITSISCTMAGIEQTIIDNYISIPIVTGNIVITAIASVVANPKTYYFTSNSYIKLASDISWNSTTEYITLGNSVSLNSNILTFTGMSAESPTEYWEITNNLSHAKNSNELTEIVKTGSYSAIITADDGYDIYTITCTMGGEPIEVVDNTITITSVTGNIVITVTTIYIGKVLFNNETNILTLANDSSLTNNNLILGAFASFASDTITLSGRTTTYRSSYNNTDNSLSLSDDTVFSNNVLTLGKWMDYDTLLSSITITGDVIN